MSTGLNNGVSGLWGGSSGLGGGSSGLWGGGSGFSGPSFRVGLLSAATFGNAAWTSNALLGRFVGVPLFAPVKPGTTLGYAAISNSNQQPNYDTRHDFYIRGDTNFSPTSTTVTGSIQINGGRNMYFAGADITGGGIGGKLQFLKAARSIFIEGVTADFSAVAVDQDGLVVGGCAIARLTATISGLYMTVSASAVYPGAASVGDIIIGGTLQNNVGLTAGTYVVDFGKTNVVADVSATGVMTIASQSGAPLAPGMGVRTDGDAVVGTITYASGSTAYLSTVGTTYPAGTRFFVESPAAAQTLATSTLTASVTTQVLTVTANTGPLIVPGMVVRIGTGTGTANTVVGTIAAGATPAQTGTFALTGNATDYGSQSMVARCVGVSGTYKLNQSQTVSSGTIDFFPPNPSFYGVGGSLPIDIPADRVADVLSCYGPLVYRQNNRILNTHGTNLTKWVTGGNSLSGINSASLTSVTMGTLNECTVVTSSLFAGIVARGTYAAGTTYAKGDAVSYNDGGGAKLYISMAASNTGHTPVAGAAGRAAGWWHDMTATFGAGVQNNMVFKLCNTKYLTVNDPVGGFNRDWHVKAAVPWDGVATSLTMTLTCDSAYTGNLPLNLSTADLTVPGYINMMGEAWDGTTPGEHADSNGQVDKEKRLSFLGTHNDTATSDYQAGGITSNSANNDTVEEYSNLNLKWVTGLMPGEDPVCNISWTGMQQVTVTKRKRWFQCYSDVGARTWVPFNRAPFPNPNLSTTNTTISYINAIDGGTGREFLAYGGPIYSGGWLAGSPATDYVPSGNDVNGKAYAGWTYSMASPRGYQGQRDPVAADFQSLTFTHDTGDTLSTASAGTHIGWFDLAVAPSLPGADSLGNRILIDATPVTANYLALGSAASGRRATRGRQAIPLGNNPTYVDVAYGAVTKRFGPYNIPGAPAAASTSLTVNSQTAVAAASGASPYLFAAHPIGTNTTVLRDIIVAVELAWSTARTVSEVRVGSTSGAGGVLGTYMGTTRITSNNVSVEFWRVTVPASTQGATAEISVKTSGSVNGCQIYVWETLGFGLVYDANTASNATATVGSTLTLGTPSGGAVLAVHPYGSSVGSNRRASAMTLTNTSAVSSQTIAGTVAPTDLTWNVGTEVTGGDVQVTSGGTGASILSAIAIGPAWALDANMIGGTLSNGTITQALATATCVNSSGVVTAPGANTARFNYNLGILQGLLVEPTATNLFLNSLINGTNLSTQNLTVTAQPYTISFYGTGSITLSGTASATISGTGAAVKTSLTFTPTAGTLTCTVSGTVQFAQAETGSVSSSFIPTTGTAVTRNADVLGLTGLVPTGTKTARCWHQSGDFTDVAGVVITAGAASLTGVSTKPIQGVTFI